MKIYKVQLDLRLVIGRLKKFNLHEYNSEEPIIFVEAASPDDACHLAYYGLANVIIKQDDSKATLALVNDILLDISVKKVSTPK